MTKLLLNHPTTTYINNEQDHQTAPISRCDFNDPTPTSTLIQLRNCADGSVDCAALTTSTTTMTNFNSDSDFNYQFQASNSNSEQTTPSPTYLPQCRAEGPVGCEQRDRKTLLIQGLFVPKIEPEPPPTIHELPISKSQSGGHKYGTRYFA